MKILLFFFSCGILSAQQLHHQMLSAQGGVATTSEGVKISQTLAQQSVIGSSAAGKNILMQGFQQSKMSNKVLADQTSSITTLVYPNPVFDFVNFKFSSPVEGKISVSFFDIHGRLLFFQEKEAIGNILTITNLRLAEGEYFVKLKCNRYSFATKILKST